MDREEGEIQSDYEGHNKDRSADPNGTKLWLGEHREGRGTTGLAESILHMQREVKNSRADNESMFNHLNDSLMLSLTLMKK